MTLRLSGMMSTQCWTLSDSQDSRRTTKTAEAPPTVASDMARATSHKAADGYRARDAASWTEEKLMILDAHLESFAKACAKASGWYDLDLSAGTGLNWSKTRGTEIVGSALVALEAGSPKAEEQPGGPGELVVNFQASRSWICQSTCRYERFK